jgi:hypothetical protein
MKDEHLFFEALARASARDFFVLAVGLLTMRLWLRLPADRLSPEQRHEIDATLRATDYIPDSWQVARTALRDALDAVTSVEAESTVQSALARYATSIVRLAPDVSEIVTRYARGHKEESAGRFYLGGTSHFTVPSASPDSQPR